ncbi:MAG: hypothetical protein HKO87_05640 [Acidimicrobiia bacterium]|nr:hypothetical protein [Acidimicrobiia bacterium]
MLVGLILAIVLIAISFGLFQLLRTPATDTSAQPDPSTTIAGSSTTSVPATTSTSTTSTTIAVDPFPPVGNPLDLSELALVADGIGPIAFGTPEAVAAGQLISTFGDPDEDTGDIVSTGEYGACPGDEVRVLRWGPLAIVLRAGLFVGYRTDLTYGGVADAPSTLLSTLSGLRLGDSIERLEEIYNSESLSVDFEVDDDLTEVFRLTRIADGRLLLYGPISGTTPTERVLGIYAPDACNR